MSGALKGVVLGFVAGALAVALVHQPVVALLSQLRGTPLNIYSLTPVGPLKVPQILNLMFWGGLWGIVFAAIERKIPVTPVWLKGFLFGAVLPVLVGWFIVAPLKGQPVAAGWDVSRMVWSPVINGMFGLGVALIWRWLRRA